MIPDSEHEHLSSAVASLEGPRELWQPDRHEQIAAVEILLASTIPYELRLLLREREIELARRAA